MVQVAKGGLRPISVWRVENLQRLFLAKAATAIATALTPSPKMGTAKLSRTTLGSNCRWGAVKSIKGAWQQPQEERTWQVDIATERIEESRLRAWRRDGGAIPSTVQGMRSTVLNLRRRTLR